MSGAPLHREMASPPAHARTHRRARPLRWLSLCLLMMAVSCGGHSPDEVLGLLERAASLHHHAAALAARGDLHGAQARLEEVCALEFPSWAVEGEDVVVDANNELGALLLRVNDALGAERAARAAISRSTRDSYFRGLAYLRLGDALRALGRPTDAVHAFERSIAVNRATMQRLSAQEAK